MTTAHFQIMLLVGAALYLLPSLIAVARGHRHQWAIVGVDLLFGWTLIGWIGALAWSRTTPKPRVKRGRRSVGTTKASATTSRRAANAAETWDDAPRVQDPYRTWLDSGATLDAVDRRFAIRLVRSSRPDRPVEGHRRAA